ncbi:type II secretion system protein GspM [Myxococcaceae bacterium GXIMD 01537]
MGKLRELLNQAQLAFERLSARERRMVTVMGAALLAFVLFITIFSFASSAARYRSRTADKMAKLQEVQVLAASYRDAQQARQAMEQQLTAANVQLITYIGEKASAAGIEVPTLSPKGDVGIGDGKIVESTVELTLTDVDLRKLTDFLRTVESGPGVVKVKTLRIEPRPASNTLTAWVGVSTYKMKQEP